MGIVAADYDRDGDTDIFVFNDVAANFFWQNDGRGRFEEVGLLPAWPTTATATNWAAWASIAATTTTTAGWTSS